MLDASELLREVKCRSTMKTQSMPGSNLLCVEAPQRHNSFKVQFIIGVGRITLVVKLVSV